MTYIVPNYFIENSYPNLISIDNLLCLNYITKHKNDTVYVRTTMHSIVILLEGSKVIHLNDQDMVIDSGEISFLRQNNYYMSERLTADSTYKSLLIYFDDQFIFDLIQKYNMIIDTKEEKNIISVNYKSDALFTCNVENFQQYLEQNFDTMLLKLKIEELFLQAIRLQKSSMHAFINAILSTSHDRIKFILESNIDLIQTLEDMCALTRLTQSKIRRYIKNEYNVTPKIWLDTKRLEKAELMLKNTDKSISDIATECGYATVSWFISQFKKHYKRTPKEFRHKM